MRSGHRVKVLIVALIGALLVTPSAAGAARSGDDRTDMVRRHMELLEELDELAASDAELAEALVTMDVYLELQVAEVERAQVQLAEATIAAEAAADAETAKQVEIEQLEELMAAMAVAAYVAPPGADYMTTLQNSSAPGDAARLNVYLDVQAERDSDLVGQLREARAELERLVDQARASRDAAEASADEASRSLAELDEARIRLAELHAEVRARQAFATEEIEGFGAALARSNDLVLANARSTPAVPLTNVRGIRVHSSIAGQLELMLAAAEADGVILSGGGYRSNTDQIELRRRHCGDDPYAIFEMPPGECSPPTARPGNSLHELGLAIDFSYNGVVIGSHDNPGFRWLAEHAHLYGFHNLASEPWHWSLNGT